MSDSFTTRPEIRGTFGVVSSTHWLASQVAMGVLERGGNAYDAAVAGGFTLQIVEPHLNGPGGEVPILFWSEREQRMRALCGQGPAPALATPAYFRDLGVEQVPGIGLLPATVPGAFGAWLTLLRDYGTWELADVLQPAIDYARNGFPLVPRVSQAILAVQALFRDEWTTSRDVWLPEGRVPAPDTLFRTPAIAATYTRILDEAHAASSDRRGRIDAALKGWYRGFVADAIDAYYTQESVRDTTGQRNRGLLRKADLADWRATYDEPATTQYGRYTVAKCGVWSQGPVHLQQLAMLRHLGVDSLDPTSPQFVHRIAEVAKLAFADRAAWYGDPDFVQVPLAALLSDAYAQQRAAGIGARASTTLQPGSPAGIAPRLPDLAAADRTLAASDIRFGVGEPTFAALPPVAEWAARHLPDRRHRPRRQHGGRHAFGWLAVVQPGRAGAGLSLDDPPADDLAGRRRSGPVAAGQAPLHHLVARPGAARRATLYGVRHTGRRPAGPMDRGVLPAPCDGHEPAGSHRRAFLAHRALPGFVLAAHADAESPDGRVPLA